MSNWLVGMIITKLTQHKGFNKWVRFQAKLEMSHQLRVYKLFCEANDEPASIEGFEAHLDISIRG